MSRDPDPYKHYAERAVIEDLEHVDEMKAEIASLKRENERLTNELAQYRIVAADLTERITNPTA